VSSVTIEVSLFDRSEGQIVVWEWQFVEKRTAAKSTWLLKVDLEWYYSAGLNEIQISTGRTTYSQMVGSR
jgi:hypothetical protein